KKSHAHKKTISQRGNSRFCREAARRAAQSRARIRAAAILAWTMSAGGSAALWPERATGAAATIAMSTPAGQFHAVHDRSAAATPASADPVRIATMQAMGLNKKAAIPQERKGGGVNATGAIGAKGPRND